MNGMIKKDLFMIKNNYRSIIFTIVIYIFYTIMFKMDMSFLLPFMSLMICISTFNYDDFNNWHSFATSLPKGKLNVVKSKYVISTSLIVITATVSILINYLINSIRNIGFDISISVLCGELLAIVFIMALIFPIIFKYGAEKGRIAMAVAGLSIAGIVALITKVFKIKISPNVLTFIDSHIYIIFIILIVLMIGISYFISKKIYLKKEF
ncbi:MAG: ABC-2 transporter permease [Bacilli bacterium]|nr:ABC-2 transporter permease [Bacilli bacterium]